MIKYLQNYSAYNFILPFYVAGYDLIAISSVSIEKGNQSFSKCTFYSCPKNIIIMWNLNESERANAELN